MPEAIRGRGQKCLGRGRRNLKMIGVGKNSTHNYNVGKKKKKNNLEFKTVRYRVASENHCIK